MSKITNDETEQLIALAQENVALYDQSSDNYSSSSSLKQMSNNSFEWTGAMNDAEKKGAKCMAHCIHKYNQKQTQFPVQLLANFVHTLSFCRVL